MWASRKLVNGEEKFDTSKYLDIHVLQLVCIHVSKLPSPPTSLLLYLVRLLCRHLEVKNVWQESPASLSIFNGGFLILWDWSLRNLAVLCWQARASGLGRIHLISFSETWLKKQNSRCCCEMCRRKAVDKVQLIGERVSFIMTGSCYYLRQWNAGVDPDRVQLYPPLGLHCITEVSGDF